MGRVICFANNKGGVGKTTSCVSLGLIWAEGGKKVLFIDLDSQANLTYIVGDKELLNTREYTVREAMLDHKISPIEKISDNVDLMPAGLTLATFDRDSATYNGREYLLLDLVKIYKDKYDYILIDCPPALGLISYNALIASDYLIEVTSPDGLSYTGLSLLGKQYLEVCSSSRLNPELQLLGVIITLNENTRVNKEYIHRLKLGLEDLVLKPVISKATRVSQANSLGTSIVDFEPDGKITTQYRELAGSIDSRIIELNNSTK